VQSFPIPVITQTNGPIDYLTRRNGSTTGKVFTLADLIHFATSN
jgi:hypothetical protein